jgi:hypothetical protein
MAAVASRLTLPSSRRRDSCERTKQMTKYTTAMNRKTSIGLKYWV